MSVKSPRQLSRFHAGLLASALALGSLAMAADALARDEKPGAKPPRWEQSEEFKAIDTDRDGKLSEAEIRAFAAARTAEMDTNKDGVISPEEMRAFHDKQREKMRLARLARMDDNKDGIVSAEEYQKHMAEGMMRHANRPRDGHPHDGMPLRHGAVPPPPEGAQPPAAK